MTGSALKFWLAVAVGVVLTGHGLVQATRTLSFVRDATTVEATVVEVKRPPAATDAAWSVDKVRALLEGYDITFAFSDVAGTQHSATEHFLRPADYATGQTVDVMYDPKAPAESARFAKWVHLWAWPALSLLAGGLALVTAAALGARD